METNENELKRMVKAAKLGQWDQAFGILDSHPYFINCIPEGKSWAALHQAVWLVNKTAVVRLLENKACDSLVRTRLNLIQPAGMTPADVARSNGSYDIEKILDDFTDYHRHQRLTGDIVYFEAGSRVSRESLPFILRAINGYGLKSEQSRVHPHQIFHDLMQKEIAAVSSVNIIYSREGTGQPHWTTARDVLSLSMKSFCLEKSDELTHIFNEQQFYSKIVEFFIREGGRVYEYANQAFNRIGHPAYKPSNNDLAFGPYALMLNVLLLYWKELSPISVNTYVGIMMSRWDAVKNYVPGRKVVWLQFVSSSSSQQIANNNARWGTKDHYVLYRIDNSAESRWRPRDVTKLNAATGRSRMEEILIYPAGAEFEVASVSNEQKDLSGYIYTVIHLKLQ